MTCLYFVSVQSVLLFVVSTLILDANPMRAPRIDILPITTYIDFSSDAVEGSASRGSAWGLEGSPGPGNVPSPISELHVPSSDSATSSPSATPLISRGGRTCQTQLSFSALAVLCKAHGHQLLGWKLSEAKVGTVTECV
jgi:hypothetical protein